MFYITVVKFKPLWEIYKKEVLHLLYMVCPSTVASRGIPCMYMRFLKLSSSSPNARTSDQIKISMDAISSRHKLILGSSHILLQPLMGHTWSWISDDILTWSQENFQLKIIVFAILCTWKISFKIHFASNRPSFRFIWQPGLLPKVKSPSIHSYILLKSYFDNHTFHVVGYSLIFHFAGTH